MLTFGCGREAHGSLIVGSAVFQVLLVKGDALSWVPHSANQVVDQLDEQGAKQWFPFLEIFFLLEFVELLQYMYIALSMQIMVSFVMQYAFIPFDQHLYIFGRIFHPSLYFYSMEGTYFVSDKKSCLQLNRACDWINIYLCMALSDVWWSRFNRLCMNT